MKCSLLLVALLLVPPAEAKTHRDPAQRQAFVHAHPCPSTGKSHGRCPGYVVDHVVPLCAGGADAPGNMQWQELGASKRKDAQEREQCRRRP